MVDSLLHPLNIFIVGLGGGFLIPMFYRLGKSWGAIVFVLALTAMTIISGYALFTLSQGASSIEIQTGGANPYAINLRMGLAEAVFAFSVNLVASWRQRMSCERSTEQCCSTCCLLWASRAW